MDDWLVPLAGGVLIGLSATLLLVFNGRIAGVSGILNGMLQRTAYGGFGWRLSFLLGLMGAGGLAMWMTGQDTPSPVGTPWLVVAGLLVGFGTRMGGGCTSGHGVCGLGRLSKRSLVAVGVFMGTAAVTVWIVRHGFGGGT